MLSIAAVTSTPVPNAASSNIHMRSAEPEELVGTRVVRRVPEKRAS
jgi:hypothetical protein